MDPTTAESAAIDSLRAQGRWDEAAAAARQRVRRFEHHGGQPSWRRRDARDESRWLDAVLRLPASRRESLGVAERARRDAWLAHHSDQLGIAVVEGERALLIHRRTLGADHCETARSAMELGHTFFELGRIGIADSLARAALPVLRSAYGETHPRVAEATALVGWIVKNFSEASQRGEALVYYQQAMRVHVLTAGPASLEVAATQQDLASLLRLQGRIPEAEALLENALEIRRRTLPPLDEAVASTYSALGTLNVARGHWDRAATYLREANAIRRAGTREIAPFNLSYSLNMYGAALSRSGRAAEAIPLLREASAMRESLWVRAGDSDPGHALFQSLSSYFELAAALAQAGRASEAIEMFDRGSNRWLVERRVPHASADDPWHGLTARVQQSLAPDAALLLYIPPTMPVLRGDYPRWVGLVRPGMAPKWFRIPGPVIAPGAKRSGAVLATRALLAASGWPMHVPVDAALARQLHFAWQEQFAMLEPHLSGVRQLMVVMPGLGQALPLEALVDAKGRALAERFRISYAPSVLLHVLGRASASGRRPVATRPALLVGDPRFAAADSSRLAQLPGSRAEVLALAKHFSKANLLVGPDATVARLASLAALDQLRGYGTLHISTHTEVDVRRPLASALVLAADPRHPDTNGRLRASTIAQDWHLDADLVSLASCRSSIGHPTMTDGSLGLSQAMLAAGARSVLASLWPTDDRATDLLMQRFYASVARGVSRAEALREAKCWLHDWREADGSRPYAHPTYWAGFVLIGDPG